MRIGMEKHPMNVLLNPLTGSHCVFGLDCRLSYRTSKLESKALKRVVVSDVHLHEIRMGWRRKTVWIKKNRGYSNEVEFYKMTSNKSSKAGQRNLPRAEGSFQFLTKSQLIIPDGLTPKFFSQFRCNLGCYQKFIFFGGRRVKIAKENSFLQFGGQNDALRRCWLIPLKDIFKGYNTKLFLRCHHWYLLRYDLSKVIADAKVARIQMAINRPIMVRLRENFRFGIPIII